MRLCFILKDNFFFYHCVSDMSPICVVVFYLFAKLFVPKQKFFSSQPFSHLFA